MTWWRVFKFWGGRVLGSGGDDLDLDLGHSLVNSMVLCSRAARPMWWAWSSSSRADEDEERLCLLFQQLLNLVLSLLLSNMSSLGLWPRPRPRPLRPAGARLTILRALLFPGFPACPSHCPMCPVFHGNASVAKQTRASRRAAAIGFVKPVKFGFTEVKLDI